MSTIFKISPTFEFLKVGAEHCYLLGETERHTLYGRLYTSVLHLINGKRSSEDIVARLSSTFKPEEIYYCLLLLSEKGFISKNNEIVFFSDNKCKSNYDEQITTDYNSLKITGSSIEVELIIEELQHFDRNEISSIAFPPVEIIVCSDFLEPTFSSKITKILQTGHACYPVKLSGNIAWFGTILKSGQRPCFECIRHQLKRNRPVDLYLEKLGYTYEQFSPPENKNVNLMKIVIRKAILNFKHQLENTTENDLYEYITTFDPQSLNEEKHFIRNMPQCSICGKSDIFLENVKKPVILNVVKRHFTQSGGYRSLPSEKTLSNLAHLVSPLTGIICNVMPVKTKDHPIRPVYSASYFVHPPVSDVGPHERFVTLSHGKGHTSVQAKTSALCEAIERYNAMFQGDEPIVRGTYKSLKGCAVDPNKLQNFSKLQYQQRIESENQSQNKYKVPLPFDEDIEIDWTYAWSMTRNKLRLLPASYCYAYYPVSKKEKMCSFTSNGNAAGNTLEEAILQGYLELIERDCVAVWWYNRICRPKIDIYSFNDHYFVQVHKHYLELGWEQWVLDITHDIEIPVAVSVAFNKKNGSYIIGMGCHIDLHIAVQRAITEMHQVFEPENNGIWKESEIDNSSFLYPDNSPATNSNTYLQRPHSTIDEDVRFCIAKTDALGLETIILNYTRPDIDLKTVKVIVPELRHFWPRLGPGRLYDVPVKMKWSNRKLTEFELNPLPLQL